MSLAAGPAFTVARQLADVISSYGGFEPTPWEAIDPFIGGNRVAFSQAMRAGFSVEDAWRAAMSPPTYPASNLPTLIPAGPPPVQYAPTSGLMPGGNFQPIPVMSLSSQGSWTPPSSFGAASQYYNTYPQSGMSVGQVGQTVQDIGGVANNVMDILRSLGIVKQNAVPAAGGPPAIGAPPGTYPGPTEAGMGGAIVKMGRKVIPAVVAGVIGEWVYDTVKGWIFRKKRHKHMNVLNPRALTRANRRMEGFRKVSTKALRELGYHVSRNAPARARARGHRPGCGCVVCKRG